MNMPFISLSETKNAYFMSGKATDQIYVFSLHQIQKTWEFLFIIYNFKRGCYFANDVTHVRTLRNINDDVA